MKIIFLDYDGVVNTLIFDKEGKKPKFNFPEDNKVNNFQAICWLNKLCKEQGAKIVVTSTWRKAENYKECLYNGGLDKDIEILGKTDELGNRGEEIKKWLKENKDIEDYIIIDDEEYSMGNLIDKLVKTDTFLGITYYTYNLATLFLNGEEINLKK